VIHPSPPADQSQPALLGIAASWRPGCTKPSTALCGRGLCARAR